MDVELTIGKYTLESLTNGMYASPLDLYREYIQNAVDSFDEAVKTGIAEKEELQIQITLDNSNHTLSILDNGCGISKDMAAKSLLDIGNSRKKRSSARGFRGIGHLAGLGYCSKLTFVTSRMGEAIKTEVVFDTAKLKQKLLIQDEADASVQSVLSEIVTVKYSQEKSKKHYFEVVLENVDMPDKIMNHKNVENYLMQHAPVPFKDDFDWQSVIIEKFKLLECNIYDYNLILCVDGDKKRLYKPYENKFIADRIKKISDEIQDIKVVPIYREESLSAILWYAQSEFYGTIIDSNMKGIRVRHGNILIGGKSTFSQFFKEERFNGWLIGEIHIFDNDLIINSRRDDFEKNDAYYEFVDLIQEWSVKLLKEIRKKSYDRNLSASRKKVIYEDNFEDVNGLGLEWFEYADEVDENKLIQAGESVALAEEDYYSKLSTILSRNKGITKYTVLNINDKMGAEEKKVLEKVFDLISMSYSKEEMESFISVIAEQWR